MLNNLKKIAAIESMKFLKKNMILGLGTGTAINFFIEELKNLDIKNKLNLVISSSNNTKKKLEKIGINTTDISLINYVDLYIDSPDEIDNNMYMIKGKGGTFTKEKIISYMSKKFICISDIKKNVTLLGNVLPVPIEVIPESIRYVYKRISEINGKSILRDNFKTDNGNLVIDVYNLNFDNIKFLEIYLNSIPGVIENGIFSHRKPDILILSSEKDISYKYNKQI